MFFLLQSFLPAEAANIIDQVPDLLGSNAGFAVQAGHRGTQAVTDIDENLPVRGSMIPLLICEIGSPRFSSRSKLFGFFAIAAACRAVAIGAQAVIKPLPSRERFRSRGDRVLDGLWIRGRT